MSVMAGKDGELKLGTNKVGYIDSWSINSNRPAIETSQIGKDYKEFIHGPMDWAGSFSGTLDAADPAQKEILAIFSDGGEKNLDAVFKVSASLWLKGAILVSSMSITGAHGDKVAVSCNFQGTGALTESTTEDTV